MTIYDIDDFLEDESDNLNIKEGDNISNLCFSVFDSESGAPIGTGFIVDNYGLFVSAGHNFKTEDNIKAYFQGKEYDIKLLEKEYVEREPIEFAIGRLLNFDLEIQEPTFATEENLNIGFEIKLCGLKKDIVHQSEILEKISLPSGILIYKQRVGRIIPEIRRNNPLSIVIEDSKGFAVPFETIEKALNIHGFSGGPAYVGNKIYGIITSHYFIKTDYWLPLLNKHRQ